MKCSRCAHDNPPGGRFCGECGATLERACASCGAANPPSNKFCNACGGALHQHGPAVKFSAPENYTPRHLTERIRNLRTALEGERKQITVLFADLKGSMELLADRDPEEARRVLDPVLECMMDAVHRYEGTVNQVLGDGIMALFGAPLAHEDHGVRACYAALRMQEAVKRYAQEVQRTHGVPLQIRVGLNSGEVVVRAISSDLHMDYTAVGQSTHLAARMEQAAMPGSILISGATLRLAEGYVQVKPLGKIQVKGLAEPVDAFELTGALAVRTRLQAAANRGLTQFVGRDAELDLIKAAWEKASGGEGRIVAVVGEAGVGKSRLFYEFAHSAPRESWLMLESASVSYGKSAAYLPVIELLRSYFKIHDRDDHRVIREKVTGKLLALDEALRSCVPAVLALLDVPHDDAEWERLDPEQRRLRTLEAVKRLLIRESEVQPLLVVFEDLHGIDAETQAFLDELVELLPRIRLLLLVNYRPEYTHCWSRHSHYAELRIDPLAPQSAAALLDALLGFDPSLQFLKRLLAQRTGGFPFFLEESVRAFIEIGALEGQPGAYRATGAVTTIQVPSTVQPIIAARIDRLPPLHKQLLQAATVIGTSARFSLLQSIADLPEEVLREALAHLQAAGFIDETSLFPESEYTFKHALTHEVAYGTLLQEQRRALHARIVEALERLHGGRIAEHVDRLAHHAVRGEVWDKAVSYCYQAGAKAAAKSAHREAVGRFNEALASLERLPRTDSLMEQAIDLRFSLRTSLSPLGEFQRSFELLGEAEAIATTLHDRGRLARVFTFKALYYWSVGRQDHAIAAAEQAAKTAAPVGERAAQVLADLFAGRARHARGDYAEAIALLERVVAATEDERGNFFGMANLPSVSARTWLAWALAERGDFGAAIVRGNESIYIAEALDHLVSRIYAYMAVGIVHLRRGDLPLALVRLRRAHQLSETESLRMCRATAGGYLGRAYILSGRGEEAIAVLEEAIDAAAGMELMVDQGMRLVHLAEAKLRTGRVDEAQRTVEQAVQVANEYAQRGALAWAKWLLGEIEFSAEAVDGAEAYYRDAMTLASEMGMMPLEAHCLLGIGRTFDRRGQHAEAQQFIGRAADLYRTLGMPLWESEATRAARAA